jgi:HK97 gp10 family phage protein
MNVTGSITGIADVNRMLQEIAPREARNILKATVHDIASQLAKSGKANSSKAEGKLRKGIKAKRERGSKTGVESTVRVAGAFYWRYLEYGQGPDGVEHAMFLKALEAMRPDLDRVYLEAFVKKLEARMVRLRKKAAG